MHTRASRRHRAVLAVTALAAGTALSGCARPQPLPADPPPPLMAADRCQVKGQAPGGTAKGTGADLSGELDRLRAACERAVPMVAEVWPAWTGTAHIEVSSTVLDAGTAAYVEGFAREGEPTRDDRVIVSLGLAEELTPAGLDVVIRHELTHLAMRSNGTTPLPLWASEGFAMHVGYAPVTGPQRERRVELERLRARVEGDDWPGTVPGAAMFDDVANRSDAYTAAWLGVEVLLERLGRDRLVEAMAPSATEPSPLGTTALTDEERAERFLGSLGVSRQMLEERWRAELVRRTS